MARPSTSTRVSARVDVGAGLDRLVGRLDALAASVKAGARSVREHEAHVDEAEAISAALRALFRGPA